MSGNGHVSEAVAFWFGKAQSALNAAEDEQAAGRHDFAINRAYYAVFYAASALLLRQGKSFVKHAGVRAAVHTMLVKSGLITRDLGRVFDRLFESRQEADYLLMASPDSSAAADAIECARRFVEAMRDLAGRPSD